MVSPVDFALLNPGSSRNWEDMENFFVTAAFACMAVVMRRFSFVRVASLVVAFTYNHLPIGFVEMTKLVASNASSSDYFALSLSLSGDYALVGSPYSAVSGINGQGAAYVYFHQGSSWNQQAKLVASDGLTLDYFGSSVSLYGDYALVGAREAAVGGNIGQGSAYVFLRSGTMWSQQVKLVASDGVSSDWLGESASLFGSYALLGAYRDSDTFEYQGSAYVFITSNMTWSQQAKLVASDAANYDYFGYSVSLSDVHALVGALNDDIGAITDQGSAYVFLRTDTTWTEQSILVASDGGNNDRFGGSVSLSGDYAVIGAYGADVGGNIGQGSAYVFLRSGTMWSQQVKLFELDGIADDYLGMSVTISNNLIVICGGGIDVTKLSQGAAIIYTGSGSNWTRLKTLLAPDPLLADNMGESVSMSGDYILVGVPSSDGDLTQDSGSAYVYYNNSGSWEFACGPGMNVIDESLCLPCELGKYKDWIGDTCLPCPIGRYSSSTGSLNCTVCETGKYNGLTGQFACTNCPSGKYNPNQESTSISFCLNCSSGKYLPFSGGSSSSDCIDCSVGTYSTVEGADDDDDCLSCDSILSGSSSPTGSNQSSVCVCQSSFFDDGGVCSCDVGFGYDGDSCVACSRDSIKPAICLSTCSSCKSDDANSVSNINSTACICGVGFVMADQGCLKCVGGMICDEVGSVLTSISLESGYWRESSTDLSTRECPYEDACTGSSDISNQCVDGHSGPLCAVCEDGYTSANSNSACGKCFEGSHATGFSLVIIVLVVLIVSSIVVSQIDTNKLSLWFTNVKSVMKDRDTRVRFRILLAYFQIIGSFTSVLSSSLPANYTTFLTITQMASLDFGPIFAPRCFNPAINFYDELLVQTIGPILVGIIILLIFVVSFIINPSNRDKARSDFLSRIFLSSFIFFPSASTSVFQIFNCDDDFESGSSYLKADYRLECDGPEYDGYVGYSVFMILIYPIGIPLFYFVCLWFQRERICAGGDFPTQDSLKDIFHDIQSVESCKVANYICASALNRCKVAMLKLCLIERACANPVTAPYSSLFGAYKPEYWYWESVECVRRLSLTGLLVFMYPGTEKQVLLAMLICFLWMMIYSSIQPYLESSHSFYMISYQWGILLQLYGIYLIINSSFGNTMMIGGFCIVVGLLVFAYGIWSMMKAVRSKLGLKMKLEANESDMNPKL